MVFERTGPVSYNCETEERVRHCHVDQLRSRLGREVHGQEAGEVVYPNIMATSPLSTQEKAEEGVIVDNSKDLMEGQVEEPRLDGVEPERPRITGEEGPKPQGSDQLTGCDQGELGLEVSAGVRQLARHRKAPDKLDL